jgi:hypothetical protein
MHEAIAPFSHRGLLVLPLLQDGYSFCDQMPGYLHAFSSETLKLLVAKAYSIQSKGKFAPGKGKGKGKVILCFLPKHHAMKAYWGVEV